ncbi:hypothetical protein [Piscinibacterium candidicorallinum]|uniref:Uncharacterized protein n=1 Tax=Piscinibacterium candidicorallinum TaxID=1793872 RepID=A0ABV7H8U1_9BURK
MFFLPQPSMVIQAADVPWRYQMDYTPPFVAPTATLDDIIATIRGVFEPARGTPPPARMHALVLNAHGQPAQIGLGSEFITASNVQRFARAIRDRFSVIYIMSCLTGRIQAGTVTYSRRPRWGGETGWGPWRSAPVTDCFSIVAGDGHHFCQVLAHDARAEVHAGTEVQVHSLDYRVFPRGWIDEYEGREVVYDATGRLIAQRVRPSYDDERDRSMDGPAMDPGRCDVHDMSGTTWCRIPAPR